MRNLTLGLLCILLAGCVKNALPGEEPVVLDPNPPVVEDPPETPSDPTPLVERLPAQISALESTQSIAAYGHFLFAVSPDALLTVIDIDSGEVFGSTTLAYDSYEKPHANTSCFGRERYAPDDLFPLLYVSQWHGDGRRGVLVYRVELVDSTVYATLVQAIFPEKDLRMVMGAGSTDWVVDTDYGLLYSFAYLLPGNSGHTLEDNAMVVSCFRLPSRSEGVEVRLTTADLRLYRQFEMFLVSQDKTYYNGRLYVMAGSHAEPGSLWFRIISLPDLTLTDKVDLSAFGGEPQGITFTQDGRMLMTYYYVPYLYKLNYDPGPASNPFYISGGRSGLR